MFFDGFIDGFRWFWKGLEGFGRGWEGLGRVGKGGEGRGGVGRARVTAASIFLVFFRVLRLIGRKSI